LLLILHVTLPDLFGWALHQPAIRGVVVKNLPQAPRGRMSPEIEIAAKVSFFDRPISDIGNDLILQ
jgi:hypothetical protein